MDKKRKRILSAAVALMLLGSTSYSGRHVPEYEIIESADTKAFGRYSRGFVYIGTKEFLASIEPNEGDILVLDSRDAKDPDMKIYSSYKITDMYIRNEILEILLEYEKKYHSKWNRTLESMELEWHVHNVMHSLNYELHRTTDVDLNNDDEDTYNNIFRRILRI